MTASIKQKLIKRILGHKATIKFADEQMISCLSLLIAGVSPGEIIPCGGKHYRVDDVFGETDATWRPARIHKYHLVEVK